MSKRIDEVPRASAHALRSAAVRTVFVTALIAVMSSAQAQTSEDRAGYLTTGDGRPVTDASGECWHTAEWARGMYYRRCDAPPMKTARAAPAAVETSAKPRAPIEHVKVRPTPVPFKVSVDMLFDFDRASLKPRGRELLDEFTDRIGRAEYETIDVVGHADRIGSASYNLRLSERRADVVRDYLVAHGQDARKLSAEGLGSSKPVTAAGQCRDVRGKQLIRCLQPDRYTELDVAGSAPDAAISRAILSLESQRTSA